MRTVQSEVEKAYYLYDSGQSLEIYRDVDGNVQLGIQGAIEEFGAQSQAMQDVAEMNQQTPQPYGGVEDQTEPFAIAGPVTPTGVGEFAQKTAETFGGAAAGAGAVTLGLPGDLIAFGEGLYGAATAEDDQRLDAFLEDFSNRSEQIGSVATLQQLDQMLQASGLPLETQENIRAGSKYLGEWGEIPGGVAAAVKLIKGAKKYAAGAQARVAERGTGTVLRSGIDPTELVDDTIVAIQKLSGGATGKRTKTGQYVGGPPGLDSPQKLAALRRKMEQFTTEGEPGRFWYERSSKAILDAVGGDVEDADKLIQAIGILSPSTPVKNNMDFALQAFAQWKAGQPIKTGMYPTQMTKKLEQVFAGTPWEGRKTNNFYVNLMREIDPSRVQGVTVDIHMMRAFGFTKEVPTSAQYDFVEKEVKRIADKFGWEPQQVQAAIWVTQKAKKENRPVELTKYDFADAIADNLGQVSWESIPGRTSSHMPEMFDAPMEQQSEYHVAVSKAFLDDDGNDIVAKHLGIVSPGDFEAPGYFEGKVSPGTQTQVALPKEYKATGKALEPSAVNLVNKYAAIRGLLLKQDASAWHRPFYKAKVADMNGMDIDIGRTFSQEEISRLGEILTQLSGDPYLAPISTDKGVRVVNFDPDVNNKEFLDMVRKAADQLELDDNAQGTLTRFATEGNYFDNDWSRSPNGEDYFRYISEEGSSDLSAGDRAIIEEIQSRIDDVDADFSAKYGWSLNEGINSNFRRQSTEVNTESPGSGMEGDQ